MALQQSYLDFEKPLAELDKKIQELLAFSTEGVDLSAEVAKLEEKAERMRQEMFANLSRWQTAQVARHINRPFTLDYLSLIFTEFVELHGDRNFGDDHAIVGGLARLDGEPVMVIGHQKGRDTKEKVFRNFGMPNPEGYRKALRLMEMAERFKLPIITFVDTPGAFPGIGAEERGQAEAIARNLREMSRLTVPIIVVITGEGGSGGALAIAVGDRILMLQHSVYAVISPEGCAAILWSDGTKGAQAAEALKLTAKDIKDLEVIDEIVPEPAGGAHRDHEAMAKNLHEALSRNLKELKAIPAEELIEQRYQKFRKMSRFAE
ncbi:acetyl-CoA carboxylase carboxyltransferase subunit alpha [Geomonas nitrogeniifigens]|uniref:Acetyl-coenzyme A carboxylase carboxyl transferase subunit alpha n=1 Tax=Geomonas diazotrophica TaxID=2843197 RepID=A0ABX8JJK7_9BACT|nr:acetyl-CoA carboxylase carboxyltransferase subunit alpha [Geomonas nitrogeniifigens]QWV98560.1 acetyl-CoA carboxylase carboxyltransferase subunit alpha [Geomonas nitrogeniifigens]QXE87743.1 acetyl-CoA carboxylase carboxyltransferase subunit alpha [Geomonas nitrogeniifigens]